MADRSAKSMLLAAILLGLFAAPAGADSSFFERLRGVSPGMTQESVLAALGEPEAVVQKSVDPYGRTVEVWRYFPGLALPAQAGFGSEAGAPVAASVSVPHTASNLEMDRVRQDADFWKRVQAAGTSNPADANYRPVFRRVAPATPAAPARNEAYLVVFVDGVVQSVQLSNQVF
ncbi:MAG TPA: hypothetical protein VL404_02915 [Candidatus Eisenbacteria bacterium]|jgi:hypothetical protein|nr:hypothetical protein [Candidatus Eisenbacteria bacterium]